MSTEQNKVRKIAERIAHQFQAGGSDRPGSSHSSYDDMAAIRASLAEIQSRLAHLESHVRDEECSEHVRSVASYSNASNVGNVVRPAAGATFTAHPSQEKFGVDEAVISELVDYVSGEKKCDLEPGGKPCDHCTICSSRGF